MATGQDGGEIEKIAQISQINNANPELNNPEDVEDIPTWIQSLADRDASYESPIDINISKTIPVDIAPLEWYNLDVIPKKMKMTNTGYTLILSAKWQQERPYIRAGPLFGNYVFSQLHFHWGGNDGEGSEHTADGMRFPVEMHVVTFKSCYLTQEAALKERDGIAVLVYLFQTADNPAFQILMDHILNVQKPHTSVKINPMPLGVFVKKFERDYFVYWGSVITSVCVHYILWLVTRLPVGISSEQVENLRAILNVNEEPMTGNFRDVQPLSNRKIFHVCPSGSKYATLLPLP